MCFSIQKRGSLNLATKQIYAKAYQKFRYPSHYGVHLADRVAFFSGMTLGAVHYSVLFCVVYSQLRSRVVRFVKGGW